MGLIISLIGLTIKVLAYSSPILFLYQFYLIFTRSDQQFYQRRLLFSCSLAAFSGLLLFAGTWLFTEVELANVSPIGALGFAGVGFSIGILIYRYLSLIWRKE